MCVWFGGGGAKVFSDADESRDVLDRCKPAPVVGKRKWNASVVNTRVADPASCRGTRAARGCAPEGSSSRGGNSGTATGSSLCRSERVQRTSCRAA